MSPLKPLCIDLFCGLGGWTEGFLSEGWRVVGFDIEQHVYGEERYPAQLVLQDVRTIHGKQFKDADMIVASSPCQAYSYMAMPWSKAKAIATALRGKGAFPEGYKGYRTLEELNELFEHPKRIQREAIAAAGGRFIPLIQENVRGAIPWVGRSQWHYGSFHLWGDVPALMPTTMGREILKAGVTHRADGTTNFHGVKVPGMSWHHPSNPRHRPGQGFNTLADRATKNQGGPWFNIGSPGQKVTGKNPVHALAAESVSVVTADGCASDGVGRHAGSVGEGLKVGDRNAHRASGGALKSARWTNPDEQPTDGTKVGGDWFSDPSSPSRTSGSKSKARKAASAKIAKIPFPLSSHIARVYYPRDREAVA